MERPKKTAGRPNLKSRQSQINVRLSAEEIRLIKETANKLNLGVADTLVMAVKMLADSLNTE